MEKIVVKEFNKQFKSNKLKFNLENLLKVLIKLSMIDAYDLDMRIKNEIGQSIPNTNILNLLNDIYTDCEPSVGIEEFVKLLHKANIEPELVYNESIKSKLNRMSNESQLLTVVSPPTEHEVNKKQLGSNWIY